RGRSAGFWGPRIPPQVEAMAQSLQELEKEIFRKLLKATVGALEGKECQALVKMAAESAHLSEEQLAILLLPPSSLKIPEEFIADFAKVVFGNRRPLLEAALQKQGNRLPTMEDFRWRVDVAISTRLGILLSCRALQPSILMQLKISDGSTHRFEVPVAKFQELRYNIALILKEMNDLEKRSILKIQD
uniref:COMM domain-containing protein 5 n=1 Tax=Naja naja TaxID=35670 RepID=A0A8C6XN01_NAJNA